MAAVTRVVLDGESSPAKEILRREWDHLLYQTQFGLILSVLCGSVALYDICILLSDEERECWQAQGELFLNDLAKRVREDHVFTAQRKLTGRLEFVFDNEK